MSWPANIDSSLREDVSRASSASSKLLMLAFVWEVAVCCKTRVTCWEAVMLLARVD